MNFLKSFKCWSALPWFLLLLGMIPMQLPAQNISYPCQGLLHDFRTPAKGKVFIEDLTLQISDTQQLSLRTRSNLSGVIGFSPNHQDVHNTSNSIHWRAWFSQNVNGIHIHDELSVNKFNGHFTFQSKQGNRVLVSIDGICNLR
jgi:hypothetical protein